MNLKQLLDKLTGVLSKRQKDIIVQRFGLGATKPKTLAQIGDKNGITRERIRQIEAVALRTLAKEAEGSKDIKNLYEKAVKYLEEIGGVRKADKLVEDLKLIFKDKNLDGAYIELLFSMFKKPQFSLENRDYYSFWYLSAQALKENKEFIKKVSQFLKNKKEEIIEHKQFDKLFQQVVKNHSLKDFVALNFIQNSKKFAVNSYGDFGLAEWREIMPKTVRDKSYLILKKTKIPMHFRKIADEINKIKFDIKRAHPQTVHNELIKDQRFVLVGRGLYSLKEFGIFPGTTRQVLQKVLKENGPLPVDKIIELVSRQRILKNNTILLNLHNRKFFKRVGGGLYHIA